MTSSVTTSTAEHASQLAVLGDRLRAAQASDAPIRIVGQGTWLDAGRPVHAERSLELRALSGVLEYVPGDLVMTVAAGTTLATIAETTREHGQWLALDPFGSDNGSIGATIATASSGPLALGAGRARDLVLGASVLAADGTAVRAGGRVVKNVAGFDLVRLATGAFGTLGAITDVSLRLHALPALDQTFTVHLDDARLATLNDTMGLTALGFMALELLNGSAMQACTIAAAHTFAAERDGWTLLARVAGNRARCEAQRALLGVLGDVHEVDGAIWRAVRDIDGSGSAVARISAAPSELAATVSSVQRCLVDAGITDALLCVTPYRGSVRLVVPLDVPAWADGATSRAHRLVQSLRALQHEGTKRRVSVIWERLPAACWTLVAPANDNVIAARIQDAFDPRRILNRGIFGDALVPRAMSSGSMADSVSA